MMTDENQVEDQDVELHDDENEIMEAQALDLKNAEAQSVASVDKAGDATGTAPKRKGDKGNKDPMQKLPGTKAGMINAMYSKMNNMNTEQLKGLLTKTMAEGVEEEGSEEVEAQDINYQVDFSDDLNAIMENEATLSEEFKEKTAVIFEAAIKSKLAEEIDRLEEKYNEELEAEINSTKEDLVEKVDSYLNYVVENWMEENKLAVQTGLRTEIAENFMNNLKDLFTESYIEVPESKVDLVDDLADQVAELEESLNATTASAIEMAEELEAYKREAIIQEASRDLADTQVEKLKSLVNDIDFDNEETFAEKVATVKESYFAKTKAVSESADFESDDEDGETVEVSGSMAQYISALNRTSKK
tara:strand:- start:636 stop:1715 length:1080 start_codon:yes stop_codon:yes gene_type:complete